MDAAQRISTLVAWAVEHGAHLHPAAEVYQDPGTGLSLRVSPGAGASIRPFEPIVRIPTALSLSYANALPARDSVPFPQEFLARTPPHVIGGFFLVKQFLLGRESFWWPYIQALPQPDRPSAWALPPFWPADEAELLDGTNVEVGVEKIQGDVKREFKEAMGLLVDDKLMSQKASKALYHWAYCIFSSRSFRPSLVLSGDDAKGLPEGVSIDDFSVLLPLFDVGNHDMTVKVRWESNEEDKSCELRVGADHQPGQQIFNNYSMKTNAELLLGYGFMIPATEQLHNDYIHVRKRTSTPVAAEEYYISLRPMSHPSSALGQSRQSLSFSNSAPMLGPFRHVQPDMVWDIFCTLTAAEQRVALIPVGGGPGDRSAERRRQEKFFSGDVPEDCRLYLEQTIAIIQHKVMQELERLDETDVEIVGDEGLSENQKLALEYRSRCRHVLENTLEAIGAEEDDENAQREAGGQ